MKFTHNLPLLRDNYGMFNIRFYEPRAWNPLDDSLKIMNIKN